MRVTCADQSDNSSFGTREDAFCGRERAVFDAWDGSRGADARERGGGGGAEALAEAALRLLKRSAPSRTARSNESMISGDVLSSIGRFFLSARLRRSPTRDASSRSPSAIEAAMLASSAARKLFGV